MLSDNTFKKGGVAVTDPVAVTAALDAYSAKLTTAEHTVATDEARLVTARKALDGSWLTAPESGLLQKRRAQIDHAQAALGIATKLFATVKTQFAFMKVFIAGITDVGNAGTAMSANNLAAANADFVSAVPKLQQSSRACQGRRHPAPVQADGLSPSDGEYGR